jgi:gamma-glutamylcyclotransferase (GGCT)/AIG2-like uncharacterized protein YtfP
LASSPTVLRLTSPHDDADAAFLPDRAVDGGALVERPGWVIAGTLCDDDEVSPHASTSALRSDGTAIPVRVDRAAPLVAEPVPSCFLYGTLLRGESRHGAIRHHAPDAIVTATCAGRLVDLGSYPGMLLAAAGHPSTVHGELVRFPETTLAAAVRRLDAIEDFRGFATAGSLYVRRLVRVSAADGTAPLAWTYIYTGDVRAARAIVSGDWRRRETAR